MRLSTRTVGKRWRKHPTDKKNLDGAFIFFFFLSAFVVFCLQRTCPSCLGAVGSIMQGRSIRFSTFGTSMRSYVAQNAQQTYTPLTCVICASRSYCVTEPYVRCLQGLHTRAHGTTRRRPPLRPDSTQMPDRKLSNMWILLIRVRQLRCVLPDTCCAFKKSTLPPPPVPDTRSIYLTTISYNTSSCSPRLFVAPPPRNEMPCPRILS